MLRPVVQGPFTKGVIASADPVTQPKGSLFRASNVLFSVRGACTTCDGSAIVNAFNGIPLPGIRGRFEAEVLFQPIGVVPYYLALAADPALHLGPPTNLLVSSTGSGGLGAGTYYYVVTALDGAGGETVVSNEANATVGANSSITLTWDTVPNAFGYNVYRGSTPGGETILAGRGLPLPQAVPLAPTTTYTDDGTDAPPASISIISIMAATSPGPPPSNFMTLVLASPVTLAAGVFVTVTGDSLSGANGTWQVLTSVINSTTLTLAGGPGAGPGTFSIIDAFRDTVGRCVVDLPGDVTGNFPPGGTITIAGTVVGAPWPGQQNYDGTWTVTLSAYQQFVPGATAVFFQTTVTGQASDGGSGTASGGANSGTGGLLIIGSGPTPPVTDTTSQTVLYKMPNAPVIPISYTDANVVATFPACSPAIGVPPSGGTGGPTSSANSTVSGGIVGMTSRIPQFAQFTNRMMMALGNGFAPQAYWDSTGSTVNPAKPISIASISVDAFGVVTVTTSASLQTTDPTAANFLPLGSNVIIANVLNSLYNGVFVVLSLSTTTMTSTFTVRNLAAIGQSASSSGTATLTTSPLINTFIPQYPTWAANTAWQQGSLVQPSSPNGFYYKAVQGGVSGAMEPTFPGAVGQQVSDNSVVWVNAGQTVSPAPLGAGHLAVYAGSLWLWNTYPTDDSTGLFGPTAIMMSDVDNPFSWNPVNQAFIDKDDGSDGMGLATFTISAEGIPPEGSLVAFKDFAGYQIVGVFGSSNFAIQRIRSDMGCRAPRTIKFVPGFGIMRYSHLGITNFDGVRDTLVSQEIQPYMFASNSSLNADLTPVDPYWSSMSYADLTATPPMYCVAIPVGAGGSSLGALTRLLCYDMVLKCWAIVDLPFSISVVYQARASELITPLTLFGGFDDGVLQRWQAQDVLWLTGGFVSEMPSPVAWSLQPGDCEGRTPDQKMQFRRVVVRGISNGATALSVTPTVNGAATTQASYPVASSGDYEVFSGVFKNGWRLGAVVSGVGPMEVDRVTFHVDDKAIGTPGVIA